jgi:hypothetical protein
VQGICVRGTLQLCRFRVIDNAFGLQQKQQLLHPCGTWHISQTVGFRCGQDSLFYQEID